MHPRTVLVCLFVLGSAAAQGTIAGCTPGTVVAGSSSFTLVVTGTGFASGNIVQWDGTNLTTTFVNATQLTAPVSSTLVATAGSHGVRVKQSILFNNFSNTFHFTVTNPAPVLTTVSPNLIAAGGPSFVLTATGSNFNSASVMRWNGSPLTTNFGSATSLTATIAASLVATGTLASITVNTPAPGGGTSAPRTFMATNPVPSLSGLSPSQVFVNGGGFTLNAIGTNFNASTTILIDGNAVTTSLVSPTQVTTTFTGAQVTATGSYAVSVSNPTPVGGTTTTLPLSVVNPNPVVSSIFPAILPGGSTGASVVIHGSGFVPASWVTAAGVPVPIDSFAPTQIGVTIPASVLNATDIIPIRVSTFGPGGGEGAGGLAVSGPAITGVTPSVLSVLTPGAPSVAVTVNGTAFASGDVIRFNGVAQPTTFGSANSLSCTVDGSLPLMLQPGGFGLTVTRPGLTSNAFGMRVGTASFPDNVGTITLAPAPPAPGQLFDLRIELPIGSGLQLPFVPLTLVVDTAAPAPSLFTPVIGFDLVVGPGLGAPFTIVDGLGLFGPPDGTVTGLQDLSFFGVSGFRRFFRTLPITAPPPLGATVSLVAVWSDPASPIGLDATYISGPYVF